MRLIAEGFELNKLSDAEHLFAEGDRGEVRIYLDGNIGTHALEERLLAEGVVLTDTIRQDAGVVVIKFQKQIAPLLIIVGALGLMGVGAGLGWQIFKFDIPSWAWVMGGIALGLGIIYILR